MSRNSIMFLVLCLIWGSTWIAIKAGVTTVPPLMFAGTRFAVAGLLILGAARLRHPWPRPVRADVPRIVAVSLLMIPLCYGPLFWGMIYIDSGTAAVLELSLTPVALLAFALLLGDERFDRRRLFAIALGVAGLCILFASDIRQSWSDPGAGDTAIRLLAAGAVASAAIIYAWGAVLARPLLAVYPSWFMAGATTLLGGIVLIVASLALEPDAVASLGEGWGWQAVAGWLFLVLFGSLVGYTLFMRLLRDIGASRAGAYAFVSPVIAVILGIAVYGETVGLVEIVGMAIMLTAAGLALREPRPAAMAATDRPPSPVGTPGVVS